MARTSTPTYVVNSASAEFSEELLGAERLEIVDEVRPEMEDVIAREALPLLHNHRLAAHQRHFDGGTQTARPATNNQHLYKPTD